MSYEKYLKYKKKYLDLKGGNPSRCMPSPSVSLKAVATTASPVASLASASLEIKPEYNVSLNETSENKAKIIFHYENYQKTLYINSTKKFEDLKPHIVDIWNELQDLPKIEVNYTFKFKFTELNSDIPYIKEATLTDIYIIKS